LQELLDAYPALRTVHDCQQQLRQLWETVNPSRDDVLRMFREWCVRAEASGIKALEDFAGTLRRFSFAAEK
jgi:stearoyl-CoA desaturase (delta-9 desaturase)